jgi:hypothetical protein
VTIPQVLPYYAPFQQHNRSLLGQKGIPFVGLHGRELGFEFGADGALNRRLDLILPAHILFEIESTRTQVCESDSVKASPKLGEDNFLNMIASKGERFVLGGGVREEISTDGNGMISHAHGRHAIPPG